MNAPEMNPLIHLLTNLEGDSLYIGSGNESSRGESSDSSPDQFRRRFLLHWVRKWILQRWILWLISWPISKKDSLYIGPGNESSWEESSDSSPDQFRKRFPLHWVRKWILQRWIFWLISWPIYKEIPLTLGQEMNAPEMNPLIHLLTNLKGDSLYIGSGNESSRDESSDTSPDQFRRRFPLHWVRKWILRKWILWFISWPI